jgi:hypothetical protein
MEYRSHSQPMAKYRRHIIITHNLLSVYSQNSFVASSYQKDYQLVSMGHFNTHWTVNYHFTDLNCRLDVFP